MNIHKPLILVDADEQSEEHLKRIFPDVDWVSITLVQEPYWGAYLLTLPSTKVRDMKASLLVLVQKERWNVLEQARRAAATLWAVSLEIPLKIVLLDKPPTDATSTLLPFSPDPLTTQLVGIIRHLTEDDEKEWAA
jgi:hypothetical protein